MSTPSLTMPLRGARAPARPATAALTWLRSHPELIGLVVLAAVLHLWSLDRNGLANDYYSGAVRSMTESWHAFVYGAFDTTGVQTIDKPPLALWVQALSARIFGFSSWSLLVPQALMGVGSVLLTYDLVRRRFGRAAGFAGGLALATTPVAVAVARHNNPDALLVLCSVAALWFVARGLEDGRARWIVAAGVAVGLGFETKMAAALLVVPGIVAAWMWVAPRGRRAAARSLALGATAMTAVGLAWPVLMWLTPASDRPWISGTNDNSIWSLIFGYNGLGRLFGQDGGPGGAAAGGGPGGGSTLFGGDAGPLRLLNEALGGQSGWLLGFALLAGVLVLASTRLRRTDARTGWLIAVGGSLVVTAVAYSRATGIFHPYYVSLLAPMIAALVGAGVGEVLRGERHVRVFGPLMIGAGVLTELIVLGHIDGQFGWLPSVLVTVGLAAGVALASGASRRLRAYAVAAALGVLLLAPATWAFQTLGHPTSGTFPAGGPASAMAEGPGGRGPGPGGDGRGSGPPPGLQAGGPPAGMAPPAASGVGAGTGGPSFGPSSADGASGPGRSAGGMFGGNANVTEALSYARANGGGVVAVSSQNGAGQTIATGDAPDLAAIGGFSGRESQVSLDWLADAVESGRIRWVLVDAGGGGPQDGRVGSTEVMAAAAAVGEAVPTVDGMYDLEGLADELRAAG